MKENGLYTLDGILSGHEDDNGNNDNEDRSSNSNMDNQKGYRYDQHNKLDSLSDVKEKQMEKLK